MGVLAYYERFCRRRESALHSSRNSGHDPKPGPNPRLDPTRTRIWAQTLIMDSDPSSDLNLDPYPDSDLDLDLEFNLGQDSNLNSHLHSDPDSHPYPGLRS